LGNVELLLALFFLPGRWHLFSKATAGGTQTLGSPPTKLFFSLHYFFGGWLLPSLGLQSFDSLFHYLIH